MVHASAQARWATVCTPAQADSRMAIRPVTRSADPHSNIIVTEPHVLFPALLLFPAQW